MFVTIIKSSLDCFSRQNNRKKVTAATKIQFQVFMLIQGAEEVQVNEIFLGNKLSLLRVALLCSGNDG